MMGQADNAGLQVAPMSSRDFFIWRIHKDTGVAEIGQYLKDRGVQYRNLIKTSHEEYKKLI